MKISVNSIEYMVEHPEGTLLTFLRRELGLVGTRKGCNEGHCGSCTVLVDGRARKACVTRLDRLEGSEVETIENLGSVPEACIPSSGFHSRGSGAVRVLHTWHDHGRQRSPRCQPGAHGRGNPPGAQVQPLPLYGLRQHLQGDQAGSANGSGVHLRSRRWPGRHQPQPGARWAGAVGFSVPKVDAVAKVTGAPIYADDMRRDHMLYGKAGIQRSASCQGCCGEHRCSKKPAGSRRRTDRSLMCPA